MVAKYRTTSRMLSPKAGRSARLFFRPENRLSIDARLIREPGGINSLAGQDRRGDNDYEYLRAQCDCCTMQDTVRTSACSLTLQMGYVR